MGSKNRISKEILPIILKNRKENQLYVEPFVGGANLIDKVTGRRLAGDCHRYLIALFQELQKGWIPPKIISEESYKNVQNNKNIFPDPLVGYIGFNSFGGKWFGGYPRNALGTKHYWIKYHNNLMQQVPKLLGIEFKWCNYFELKFEDNSVVYCDPPYHNSTKYKDSNDYQYFWNWVRQISINNEVYISEYNAPSDFVCLWHKKVINTLEQKSIGKYNIEKLFTLRKSNSDN